MGTHENLDHAAIATLAKQIVAHLAEAKPKTELETWAIVREELDNHPDAPRSLVEGKVLQLLGERRRDKGLRKFLKPQEVVSLRLDQGAPHCKSCRAPIGWFKTRNGKNMPLNPDGTSHFDTCPSAANHRRTDK